MNYKGFEICLAKAVIEYCSLDDGGNPRELLDRDDADIIPLTYYSTDFKSSGFASIEAIKQYIDTLPTKGLKNAD